MGSINKFIRLVISNGGASYNINSGELNPTNGYLVSIADAEKKIRNFDGDDLKNYILKNAELLSVENVFLGGWVHKGEIYLDCSQRIVNKHEAITKGMRRNQLAIWDAEKEESIFLPAAQKCGTETQKLAYIELKATELCGI